LAQFGHSGDRSHSSSSAVETLPYTYVFRISNITLADIAHIEIWFDMQQTIPVLHYGQENGQIVP
jgi:hypothetical protein